MQLTELRSQRERRRKRRRRRSAVVAVLVGLALVALTAGVFTAATSSRQLAEQSSRVHYLDGLLGSTSLLRAQLGFGLVLADVDQFASIDSTGAVTATEADIVRTLDSLAESRALLTDELGGLEPSTAAALDEYLGIVDGLLPIDVREPLDGATTGRLATAYDRAQLALAAERDEALLAVRGADRRLGRISTLTSFLTAFVIPTLAVVLYRLLSAPHRDVLEADARSTRDRTVSDLRRSVVMNRLTALQHAAERQSPSLARKVADVQRTLLSLEHQQRCVFADVAVSPGIERIVADARAGNDVVLSASGRLDAMVWTDQNLLELLLDSIVADGVQRGAQRALFVVGTTDDRVTIEFHHDGSPRSPAECDVITGQATIMERMALLGGPDVDLVAALHLAGDLQGEIVIGPDDAGRQRLVLALPAAADESDTLHRSTDPGPSARSTDHVGDASVEGSLLAPG